MTADELQKFLDALGQKLTPAASHVWELAVRQQVIYGAIAWVIVAILGVGVLASFLAAAAVVYHREYKWADNAATAIVAAFAFLALILVVAATAAGPMFNPEYAALSDVISKIPR